MLTARCMALPVCPRPAPRFVGGARRQPRTKMYTVCRLLYFCRPPLIFCLNRAPHTTNLQHGRVGTSVVANSFGFLSSRFSSCSGSWTAVRNAMRRSSNSS